MKPRLEIVRHLRLEAPAARVWAVVTDHEGMAAWLGVSQSWLSKAGTIEPNGLGAERTLVDALVGAVVERVVDWHPVQSYRYRIVSNSPFADHLGELKLTPQGPQATDLRLAISFRPRWAGTGLLLKFLLGAKLRPALRKLKALIEAG